MISNIDQTAGVDISKDRLDVFLYPEGTARRFANDRKGHGALIAWLASFSIQRVVYEATGAYHRGFERALGSSGLAMAKVNPWQARRFAEATGQRAKTDKVDAAMLARLGAPLEPRTQTPPSQALETMHELCMARRALVKDRTAALNREKTIQAPLLKRQIVQRLKQIETQIEAIDQELRPVLETEKTLKARFDILMSIPGIGETTAFVLPIEMPELGSMHHKQTASLAGLAPIARESGNWKGRRGIKGGRAILRQALYMPALVAIRFNEPLKQNYDALIKAGKPAKVAITAIMRKLIILANALLRDNRKWTEKPA